MTELKNSGFEDGFRNYEGIGELNVALEWYPFWRGQAPGDPVWKNHRPEYKDAAPYNDRIHEGVRAQQYFSTSSTHDAGLFQVVFGFTPGDRVTLRARGQVWSRDKDGKRRGDMSLMIGIDPCGLADPYADGEVIWSRPVFPADDTWVEIELVDIEVSEQCTVFLRSRCKWAVTHNNVYWDVVELDVVSEDENGDSPPPEEEVGYIYVDGWDAPERLALSSPVNVAICGDLITFKPVVENSQRIMVCGDRLIYACYQSPGSLYAR